MYCVIQKIQNKKTNPYGAAKELIVSSFTWSMDGVTKRKYTHNYSDEKFERPIKDAYKISIHKSYRENGKVKKKQWVICTIGYYDIADGWTWVGDHTIGLEDKLEKIGITEEKLCNLVYKKLDPIINTVKAEFEKTEEYKTKKKHDKTLEEYRNAKEKFEKKYGEDTYDYCYDVFGLLKNESYLKELEENYKTQQEYYKSSYYKNNQSNYSYSDFSGYFKSNSSAHTEDGKNKLKKIYRVLATKFHPDVTKDDGEMMKFVNHLKEEWGI